MLRNCLCHKRRNRIAHLFILTCFTALEDKIIWEGLYSRAFPYSWYSIPFVVKVMTVSSVYCNTRLCAAQASPGNMYFSGLLQFYGKVFVVTSIWHHSNDFLCLIIVYGDVMVVNTCTILASITLKIACWLCRIW